MQHTGDDRKNRTRTELNRLMFLNAACDQLLKGENELKDMMHEIPGGQGWRIYRAAVAFMSKSLDGAARLLNNKQFMYMQRRRETSQMELRPRQAVQGEHWVQIRDTDLEQLLDAAREGACRMCMKQRREAKGCPLRKALTAIVPPDWSMDADCEYQDPRNWGDEE